MARKKEKRLTPLEALVMNSVWELSEATVRQVQDHMRSVKPLAYNTVLTMMRILRDKGFLESRRQGRLDLYRPRITRQQMGKRSLGEVLDRFFSGSARALVSQLLDSEKLSAQEIKAIRREVDKKLRGNSDGKE